MSMKQKLHQAGQVLKYLQSNPIVAEAYIGDGQYGEFGDVYITTHEDPDGDDNSFGVELDSYGLKWMANDCPGCFNEYVVTGALDESEEEDFEIELEEQEIE